ncbi:DUF1499 domain-containing protein [Luteithermobacter gelatinilyticus]|uniref:DUF1499 domain-containing protein n=1 Tax=Luteithermobacter gelatinilyticus TaxID=2582913 RepID=UPI00143D3A83|nr:DUF1499 domain-containing protein [Luteithermobacter gelatinilyticus]
MIIGPKRKSWIARGLLMITFLLGAGLLILGAGAHLNLWTPLTAFRLTIALSLYGGSAVAVLSLIGLALLSRNRLVQGMFSLTVTLIAGLALSGPVLYLMMTKGGVPPIHDITTDTTTPPQFTFLVGKRGKDANSLIYGGADTARQQQAAYPGIRPLMTPLTPEKAFEEALATARALGWEVIYQNRDSGHIEATDRTFWFNFADDIVIRITPAEQGSRIDLRSVSRVGVSDLGANAKRLSRFLAAFPATAPAAG